MASSMTSSKAHLRKPLLEKRRRARINACLNQLKNLVLETLRKDTARYSKLEKADILEMTVDYLKALRCQHVNVVGELKVAELTQATQQYGAGYRQCAAEVLRYLDASLDTTSPLSRDARIRLDLHLADCVRRAQESAVAVDGLLSEVGSTIESPSATLQLADEYVAQGRRRQTSISGDAAAARGCHYASESSSITPPSISMETSNSLFNHCARNYFQLSSFRRPQFIDCNNNGGELFSRGVIALVDRFTDVGCLDEMAEEYRGKKCLQAVESRDNEQLETDVWRPW